MAEHSAEFLRGAVKVLDECLANGFYKQKHEHYKTLLAEAEAGEAGATTLEPDVRQVHDLGGAPDAAAVIAQCKTALTACGDHIGRIGHYPGAYNEEQEARSKVGVALAAIAAWEAGR